MAKRPTYPPEFRRRLIELVRFGRNVGEVAREFQVAPIYRRTPDGVIHHSDQGCQYTSIAFGARCREANVKPSMGSVGDAYDNAMCESFNATLECELLVQHTFKTHHDASLAIFDFIEGWYNPHRRHSALGYLSPNNYERRMNQAA